MYLRVNLHIQYNPEKLCHCIYTQLLTKHQSHIVCNTFPQDKSTGIFHVKDVVLLLQRWLRGVGVELEVRI